MQNFTMKKLTIYWRKVSIAYVYFFIGKQNPPIQNSLSCFSPAKIYPDKIVEMLMINMPMLIIVMSIYFVAVKLVKF